MKRFLVLMVAAGIFTLKVLAHDPNLSGIRFILWPDEAFVTVTTHLSKLKVQSVQGADKEICSRLKVFLDSKPLAPQTGLAKVSLDTTADQVVWQYKLKSAPKSMGVEQPLFPESADASTAISVTKDGLAGLGAVVTPSQPTWGKLGKEAAAPSLASFYTLGIQHILSGLDHILFILALLLGSTDRRTLLRSVTAFTIAHSISLTLATLGIVNLSSRLVEPLIALSITIVGIENTFRKSEAKHDYRIAFVFLFGLLHGLGFAGGLNSAGLASWSLASALVSFNFGVETGQLMIILVAVPLIHWLQAHKPLQTRTALSLCNIGIGALGFIWAVQRITSGS